MGVRSQTIVTFGMQGLIIDVECHITNGLPAMVIVGSASRSIDEAKERVRNALANSQLTFPKKRITVNLAPGDIPKDGTSIDLAIAIAILAASGQIKPEKLTKHLIIGELSLDGTIRPVRGLIGKLLATRTLHNHTFIIPSDNLAQAQTIPNLSVLPVNNLQELYLHLTDITPLQLIHTSGVEPLTASSQTTDLGIEDISGQLPAKRALEIAAAGGHNILLNGPPGTGKSMLAKAFCSILPPLSPQEVLEVTHLHSLSGSNYEAVIQKRPFRAPHHSASYAAITGGGQNPIPGEVSLSHCGVLFLDELPEFSRTTIESLRQPLEDHSITVSRAKGSFEFPASFILIATANPCPCGYYGSTRECECTPNQIAQYQRKLSGPILDRIDLHVTSDEIDHSQLLSVNPAVETSSIISERVQKARMSQVDRFTSHRLNASMSNRDIKKYASISAQALKLLNQAAASLQISARSYMRIIKVARTIADLGGSAEISAEHISEALQYRLKRAQFVEITA